MKPVQIRVVRHGKTAFTVLVTWGLMNITTYSTHDWKEFLKRHGWDNIPRVFS